MRPRSTSYHHVHPDDVVPSTVPSELRQKIKLKVTVVHATGLPKVEGVHFTRQINGRFYCVVMIGEERKETKVARRSSTPEWNQLFSFDTDPNSTLRIEIFAHRKMRKAQYIGFISEQLSAIRPSIIQGSAQGLSTKIGRLAGT